MLGKLLVPAIFAAGFFLYTHPPTHTHVASAYVTQACDTAAGSVSAAFAWPLPEPGAEQIWVDLGLDANFALGWYQGHGPLPPSQNTFSIGGLTPGLKYNYRVNTLTGGKWKTIAKGHFVSACAPAPAAMAVTEPTAAPVLPTENPEPSPEP